MSTLFMFSRLILNPGLFPYVRGQEMPDPVGVPKDPLPAYPLDSRYTTQGWDKLDVIKAPPPGP
jgi:hypothetical protein